MKTQNYPLLICLHFFFFLVSFSGAFGQAANSKVQIEYSDKGHRFDIGMNLEYLDSEYDHISFIEINYSTDGGTSYKRLAYVRHRSLYTEYTGANLSRWQGHEWTGFELESDDLSTLNDPFLLYMSNEFEQVTNGHLKYGIWQRDGTNKRNRINIQYSPQNVDGFNSDLIKFKVSGELKDRRGGTHYWESVSEHISDNYTVSEENGDGHDEIDFKASYNKDEGCAEITFRLEKREGETVYDHLACLELRKNRVDVGTETIGTFNHTSATLGCNHLDNSATTHNVTGKEGDAYRFSLKYSSLQVTETYDEDDDLYVTVKDYISQEDFDIGIEYWVNGSYYERDVRNKAGKADLSWSRTRSTAFVASEEMKIPTITIKSVTVSESSNCQIDVTWDAPVAFGGLVANNKVVIYRNNLPIAEVDADSGANEFIDTNVIAGETYNYQLALAYDRGDNENLSGQKSSSKSAKINLLEAPSGLTSSQSGCDGNIEVTWSYIANPAVFVLERKTENTNFIVIDNAIIGSLRAYTDTNEIIENEVYYYRISAISDTFSCNAQGAFSAVLTHSKDPINVKPIFNTTTYGVEVSKGYFSNRTELEWSPNLDTEQYINQYKVYTRELGTTISPRLITTLDINTKRYNHTDGNAGTIYEYFIIGERVVETVCGRQVTSSFAIEGLTGASTPKNLEEGVAYDIGLRVATGVVNGNIVYTGGIAVPNVKVIAERQADDLGQSLYFNGTDAYMEAPNNEKFVSESGNMTLSAWIKPENLNKFSVVIEKQYSYGVHLRTDGSANFYIKDQNSTEHEVRVPTGSFNIGNWTNLTGTFNKETQELAIYLNGKLINVETISGFTAFGHENIPFSIGRQYTSEAHYFQGNVDEIRLYDRTLSEEEVAKESSKLIASDVDGLSSYWKVFEGTGAKVYDLAHVGDEFYKNDGVLYNTLFTADAPSQTQLGNAGYTDLYGNYTIAAVAYSNVGENFNIIPTATLGGAVHEFDPGRKTLFIGEGSKVNNDTDYEDISSFQYSGHVRFDFTNEDQGELKSSGVPGVSIYIDGKTPVTTRENTLYLTKEDGFFDIQVPIGNHYLEFRKNGHTFVNGRFPSSEEHDFQQGITGVQIFDNTTHVLSGKVAGGLIEASKKLSMPAHPGNNNIGLAVFTLTSVDGKISREIETDSETGEYSIALPPKKYNVSSVKWKTGLEDIINSGDIQLVDLVNFASYIGVYETDSVFVADVFERIDSTFYNARKDFIYRTTPELLVSTVDDLEAKLSGEEYYQLDQGSEIKNINLRDLPFPTYITRRDYQLKMKAVEIYTNKESTIEDVVGVTDGQLTINNGFGHGFYLDDEGKEKGYDVPEVLSLNESGELIYNFRTDYPNTNHNASAGLENLSFTKEMSVSLTVGGVSTYWPSPSNSNETFKSYVIGAKSVGSNFVTKSPATVDMVLRDPPGSNSYAFWEEGKTTSSTSEFYLGGFGSLDVYAGIGAHFESVQGTPFFSIGTELHATQGVGINAAFEAGGGQERTWETTLTESIETNSDPMQVGRSDVYVAKSQNLLTGMAIAVKPLPENLWASGITFGDVMKDIDGNNYKMGRVEQSFVNPIGIPTYFNYSQNHIVNVLLPDLIQIRNNLFTVPGSRYVSKLNANAANYGTNNDDPIWGNNATTVNYIRTETGDYDGESYTYTPLGDPETAIDSVRAVNQQIRLWKEGIANNEIEKWKAIQYAEDGENISFSSGNVLTKTTNSTKTFYSYGSFEASVAVRIEVHAHAYGGGALEGDLVAEVGFKGSGKFGEGTEDSITTGYVLHDADEDDAFSVNVYKGGNGNGPIFQTLAGQTSCPFEDKIVMEFTSLAYVQTLIDIIEKDLDKTKEESLAFGLVGQVSEKQKKDSEASEVELDLNQLKALRQAIQAGEILLSNATLQRDKPEMKINGAKTAQAFNVPADEAANFNLTLINAGESGDGQYFSVKAIDESNPNGLEMTIDGQSINTDREFLVQGNGGIQKVLKVRRGPNHYDYEKVGVVIKSTCQADATGNDAVLSDTIYFAAKFLPICTPIEISMPQNNWTWNDSFNNEFPITVSGYDVNTVGFEEVKVQYKPSASSEWILLETYYRNDDVKEANSGVEEAPLLPTSGNTFTYNWKIDNTFIDGKYDVRAISSCALAENTSEILSGVIDRRKPAPFGVPQPSDGILSAGEDASIQFTETINSNLLSVANFDVRGVLNGGIIRHDASIAFDGSTNTYAKATNLNLENKPFTIEFYAKKNTNNIDQIFLAQGSDPATEMLFGINSSNRFYFSLAGSRVTSEQTMNNNWHHYAVTYDPLRADVTLYIDALMEVTDNSFVVLSKLKEDVYFGKSNIGTSNPLNGNIHEVRIWSKALTTGQVNLSATKRMVGNEAGLLHNWEFEEAHGLLALDKVRGKHAEMNANWAVGLSGYGLRLDAATNQAETQSVAFDNISDFTFEFWFKSDGGTNETMLSNGKGDGTEANTSGWSVGIDTFGKIAVESNGNSLQSATVVTDNKWHHIAVVVNARGNAVLFLDAQEESFISTSLLNGFGGSKIALGKRIWYEGITEYTDQKFSGSIDELRIWNSARKVKQIDRDRFNNLSGDEPGLVEYYSFETFSVNGFGITEVVQSENNSSVSTSKSTQNVVLNGASFTQTTPVIKLKRPVEVVNISYAVNNDKVIINLNAEASKIENVQLDFTVSYVKDVNGNEIQSPITWSAYVDKNQVVWQESVFNLETLNGEELNFESKIFNNSGESKTFEITNIPSWLTVSPTSGTVGPLTTVPVSFKVSDETNNGTYQQDILLTTDFDFAEKLNVNVAVKQPLPANWTVNPTDYEYSMNVVGQISFDGILSRDEGNVLAAFVGDECRGLVNIRHISTFDNYQAFLSIYSNQATGEILEFKVWEAATGVVHSGINHNLSVDTFLGDLFEGTSAIPKLFSTTNIISGSIEVPDGWKWISFNLEGSDLNATNTLLGDLNTETNDVIKTRINVSDGSGGFTQKPLFDKFEASVPTWYGSISNNGAFDTGVLYKIKVSNAGTIRYEGAPVNPINHELNLVEGWNYIGYTGNQKIEINEGLNNYQATDGDLIKNQYYSAIYDSNYGWLGSLTILSPNDGYMLKTAISHTFKYPAFNSSVGARVNTKQKSNTSAAPWNSIGNQFSENMTIIAYLSEDSDRDGVLGAFVDGTCRGYTYPVYNPVLDENMYVLTLAGRIENERVSFKYKDNDSDAFMDVNETIAFSENSVKGVLDNPVAITLTEGLKEAASVLEVYPNPFKENVKIDVDLSEQSEIVLSVYDSSNRLIKTEHLGEFDMGKHTIDTNHRELAQGVYFFMIKINDTVFVEKVIVLNDN